MKNLPDQLFEEEKRLKEQESMYLVCGKYYRKRSQQQRATSFFLKANQTFKKRQEITQRLSLILEAAGIHLSAEAFVKPVELQS